MKIQKYTLAQAKNDLPVRKKTDHKSRGGKCLIIAGSKGMWGAGILSATAAARAGAGYVYWLSENKRSLLPKHPDFLETSTRQAQKNFKFQSVALGPGLGRPAMMRNWFRYLRKRAEIPVVVDASALAPDVFLKLKFPLPAHWVLTPHEGELSKLLKRPAKWIQKDRRRSIALAQAQFGGVWLLKGHQTLITDGQTMLRIQSGNAALAKAGTGDVLTGLIAGLLSQGLKPLQAASLAAYTHGKMADDWIRDQKDVLSLMASDLLLAIAKTLQKIRRA